MRGGPVAVVGAGLIGRGWAVSFARAGYEVRLFDPEAAALEAARAEIGGTLAALREHGLLSGQTVAEVAARIRFTQELEAAVDGVGYVQECAPEDVATKREVFARLDSLAGTGAVLASSSSALLPSSFTEGLRGRHRCLVAHPLNPPYLVPAVELVPAPWTAAGSVARTATLLRDCGHAPIVMKRETEGFVMNRLQGALLQEAFRLVAEDCASVEDVDIAVRDGLGLRWSFMGPFETIDLNASGGVRDYVGRYGPAYARIAAGARPVAWDGPLLDRIEAERAALLPRDRLGERRSWRDRQLMALIAHRNTTAGEET